MTAHYIADTERLGLGRPDAEPLASEYVEPIVGLIGDARRRRPRLRGRRRRLLPRALAAVLRRAVAADVDQMDQGEGVEGADRKEDPLDFALWKAREGGRGHVLGRRPGAAAGRAGTSSARRWPRQLLGVEFDIHGGGVDLVFPHHENEAAQTLAARGKPLARIWMHNGMLELADEKMSKSVGNIRGLGDVLDEVGPRRAGPVLHRRPLPAADRATRDERLEDAAAASVRRIRDAARRLRAGPSPEALAPLRDAFFAALRNDFNTAEALARAVRLDPRGEPARGRRRRRAPARDARRARARQPAGGRRGTPADLIELARRRTRSASGEGLGRGGPPARRAARERAGRSATARTAPSWCPWRDHLRPQRGHRGPARAAAACGGSGPSRGTGAGRRSRWPRRRRSPSAADRMPTRACARSSTRTATRTPPSCSPAPDPLLVALDEVTDPQNLGAVVPDGRGRRRDRRDPARAALGGGHARGLQGVGGRGRAPPDRARPQPRGLPRATPSRRSAGSTARTPRARTRYDRRTTAAGSSWCSAPRGKASGRGSPRCCDDLVSLPVRGRIESLNVSATAAVLLYEMLQQRLDTST